MALKFYKRFNPLLIFFFLAIFILPSCVTYRSSEGLRITSKPTTKSRCPDRLDRGRVGGLTGAVVGTIAGSALGVPMLGGLYHVAGYVMGFSSHDPCTNNDPLEKKSKIAKKAVPAPTQVITEENI
jgi:hypothetical protein